MRRCHIYCRLGINELFAKSLGMWIAIRENVVTCFFSNDLRKYIRCVLIFWNGAVLANLFIFAGMFFCC